MKRNKARAIPVFVGAGLFLLLVSGASAQESENHKVVEFGLRFMPTFTSVDVRTSGGGEVGGDAILGFGIGGFLGINFSRYIGVQGELIYSSISQKSIDNNVERRINLRYVNVPVLLSLNTGKSKVVNLNVVGGPQIGFNVGSSISLKGSNDASESQPVLSVKKSDIGFAYGAGLDFALNAARTLRLGFGYRGVIGLLDVSDKSKTVTNDSYYLLDKSKIRTHSGYAGVSIMF